MCFFVVFHVELRENEVVWCLSGWIPFKSGSNLSVERVLIDVEPIWIRLEPICTPFGTTWSLYQSYRTHLNHVEPIRSDLGLGWFGTHLTICRIDLNQYDRFELVCSPVDSSGTYVKICWILFRTYLELIQLKWIHLKHVEPIRIDVDFIEQ